jgi:curved DNA-binding protein
MARDYYDVLGVSRSATPDEIRAAYRAAARKHHPDVNKAPDAQQRFTEIQDAYDVLGDEQKRRAYDRFGHAGAAVGAQPGAAWPSGGGSWQARASGGDAVEFSVEDLGSMFDAIFGASGFESPAAGRRSPGARARRSAHRREVRADLRVDFLTAARGGTERVRIDTPAGKRTIDVTIPRAASDGTQLRVRAGGTDDPSSPDVILTVRVAPHPLFRRGSGEHDLDVFIDLPLTIAEATLGAVIAVPTLDGMVDLTVPRGTVSGQRLRLRGRGLRRAGGAPGDFFALARILPLDASVLTPAEHRALEEMSRRPPPPRTGPGWSGA